jgi:cyclopropane-fatty-acyl-phospholipid synthase
MNEASVRAISLPRQQRRTSPGYLARKALCSVFEKLQVGTLTIQEGGETLNFGRDDNPDHPHACIQVHNPAVYGQVLTGGSVGSGEAYILGHWSSPDLVEVIRLFTANMAVLQSMDSGRSVFRRLALKLMHVLNRNSLSGSRKNISAHYDLGNDFFSLFLDPSLMYSAAVFPDPTATLEVAAEHKLDLICKQLELEPGDHLLEIGTGWGGMALHAARHYGCRVTTTTLSREQYQCARERVASAGLEDRITVLCQDYRELEGNYDKLVSIEMIEAVGHQYYRNYFEKCSSLLKPGGLMVIQAITMADQRFEAAKNSVDFIQRYIFPGGCLPSMEVISRHVARDTDMQIVHMRDITDHYARTLACWRERFLDKLEQVRSQGFDEEFQRLWEFYLCYCEGGFLERVIGTVQLTMAKPAYRFAR